MGTQPQKHAPPCRELPASPSYLLPLLQLCDSALPTGAFSHSFGLEAYLARGVVHDETTFAAWLRQFIGQQLVYSDGLAIRLTIEAMERTGLAEVLNLDRRVTAQALPLQMRGAGIKIGLRMLEIGGELFPTPDLDAYRAHIQAGRCAGHTAIALALTAHGLRIPLAQMLTAYFFSTATTLTQNAVRAIPLGQRAGQRVLRLIHDDVTAAVATVMTLDEEDLGAVAPGLEIAQMRHEYQLARMFMS
ncbi:urease accessory protein UreF [Arthrobacter sp. H14-L1]|uniref:urease accessory protein UreF n=1 Tax=Arthrobacter sp. H14-L1 TaxID=2996697 RepID=UPI00226D95FE|nr:urease accessory protein UreF [Arthrobacter sp. H14-L1]MCY0905957.1 urease accessory protein UreF [Arthrobacter sp. H14-L1]